MTRWLRIRFASGYMTLSLVGGLGSDFALVVGEAAQDQEAEEPGARSFMFCGKGFDFGHFSRGKTDAHWMGSYALGNASNNGYVFHNVMICNRYGMA